jgi:hypothetical protein
MTISKNNFGQLVLSLHWQKLLQLEELLGRMRNGRFILRSSQIANDWRPAIRVFIISVMASVVKLAISEYECGTDEMYWRATNGKVKLSSCLVEHHAINTWLKREDGSICFYTQHQTELRRQSDVSTLQLCGRTPPCSGQDAGWPNSLSGP